MKRAISLAIALVFVLTVAVPSFALPKPIDDAVHKIKKGVLDIAGIPYSLVKGTYDDTMASKFKPFGLVEGVVKHSTEGAKTAITAAADIATFPLEMVKKWCQPHRCRIRGGDQFND